MEKNKEVPLGFEDKATPLCLPNNLKWDQRTRKIIKTSGERRTLHAVPEAVLMLQKIKEPVCVVSIAGPCRDGKSYILAEVFGQKEVFPVGHLVDPETTGIWIWIIPQKFQVAWNVKTQEFGVWDKIDSFAVDYDGWIVVDGLWETNT